MTTTIFLAIRAGILFFAMVCGIHFDQVPLCILLCFFPAAGLGLNMLFSGVVTTFLMTSLGVLIGEFFWNPEPIGFSLLSHVSAIFILVLVSLTFASFALNQKFAASTDFLTGLSNRYGFEMELAEHALSTPEGSEYTVVFLDCDNFKEFNDQWGHRAGDQFLSNAARVLVENLEDAICCGRLGGDEFCIAWAGLTADIAQKTTLQLKSALEDQSDDLVPKVTWSFGVAHFTTPVSVNEMMDRADHLMLEGKRHKKSSFIFRVDPPEFSQPS